MLCGYMSQHCTSNSYRANLFREFSGDAILLIEVCQVFSLQICNTVVLCTVHICLCFLLPISHNNFVSITVSLCMVIQK